MEELNKEHWIEKHWVQEVLFLILLVIVNFSGQLFYTGEDFMSLLVVFCLLYTHAQLHKSFLFPIVFFKKQYIKYVLLAIILISLFTVISYYVNIYYVCPRNAVILNAAGVECTNIISDFSSHFMAILMISPLYFVRQFYKNEKEKQESKILIQQLEIEQLKEQLNPHFMFNTLNNLFGVSLEEPARTPELILQMSQLMRYNLESSKKNKVPLADELDFINNYAAIEMERVRKRCTFTKDITLNAKEYEIAPMILLPFIENAFKHSTATSEKCNINLKVTLDQGTTPVVLKMNISNSIPSNKKNVKSTGFGLVNVKERLLRLYPKMHELTILQSEKTFDVTLQIKL
jgi:two-component system, LytTR family, sensor kinase